MIDTSGCEMDVLNEKSFEIQDFFHSWLIS